MSVESMSLVLNHSRAEGTDKLVLLGIANHDGDGGSWPSIATLARYANKGERAVIRSLRRLETMGELMTHRNAGGTHRTRPDRRPNRYEITISTGGVHGVSSATGRDPSRGVVQRAHGVSSTTPEPSLEPSSIKSPCDLRAVPPGPVELSLVDYLKKHPDETHIARWMRR